METQKQICEGLAALREDASSCDVVVVVEEAEFPCHLAILAAQSAFFKDELLSGGSHTRQRKIPLRGIKKGVFSSILSFIYGGKYVLTEENFHEIAAAAHKLQIKFLLSQCKKKIVFIELSVENCLDYLCRVRFIDDDLKRQALKCICKNFSKFNPQDVGERLEQDEIIFLVTNKKLNVKSEDDVLRMVLAWADHTSSPSQGQLLADILERTRYRLISVSYSNLNLTKHQLVLAEPRCQAVLEKISQYQLQPHLHQTWCPSAAVHREHSDVTNVLLWCNVSVNGNMIAMNLKDMKWEKVQFPTPYNRSLIPNAKVLFYDSRIFIFAGDNTLKMFNVPLRQDFRSVPLSIEGSHVRIFRDRLHFYKFEEAAGRLSITSVTNLPLLWKIDQPSYSCETSEVEDLIGMNIEQVTNIGKYHVIFFGKDGMDGYTVVWGDSDSWAPQIYPNQLGSRSPLVSFACENDVFLLQENGCLWRCRHELDSQGLSFALEKVLWDGAYCLDGAVLYNEQLIIVGDFEDQVEEAWPLDGVFQSLKKIKRFKTIKFDFAGNGTSEDDDDDDDDGGGVGVGVGDDHDDDEQPSFPRKLKQISYPCLDQDDAPQDLLPRKSRKFRHALVDLSPRQSGIHRPHDGPAQTPEDPETLRTTEKADSQLKTCGDISLALLPKTLLPQTV